MLSAATDAATSSSNSSNDSSLIPETLQQMDSDIELQATLAALKAKGQAALTREEAKARKRSLQHLNLPSFADKLQVRVLQCVPQTAAAKAAATAAAACCAAAVQLAVCQFATLC
jgi:hypothetical protein